MKKGRILYGVICFILGASVAGGGIAYAAGITAVPGASSVFVDGKEVEVEAYAIEGHNYTKLRDIGKIVNFNVYWDEETRTVHIETDKPYTGEPPTEEEKLLEENMELRKEMVDLINAVRKEHGLNELAYNEKLMNAAQERAKICADTGSLGHDKDVSVELLLKYEYGNGGAGCNIGWSAYRNETANDLVDQFVRSKGHLDTMLLEGAKDLGVGVYKADGVYVVMYIGNEEWY